jgi:hypothetical protein
LFTFGARSILAYGRGGLNVAFWRYAGGSLLFHTIYSFKRKLL